MMYVLPGQVHERSANIGRARPYKPERPALAYSGLFSIDGQGYRRGFGLANSASQWKVK